MIVRWIKGKPVYLPSASEMLSNLGNRKYMRKLGELFSARARKRSPRRSRSPSKKR